MRINIEIALHSKDKSINSTIDIFDKKKAVEMINQHCEALIDNADVASFSIEVLQGKQKRNTQQRAMVSDESVEDMAKDFEKKTDKAIKKIGRSIGF